MKTQVICARLAALPCTLTAACALSTSFILPTSALARSSSDSLAESTLAATVVTAARVQQPLTDVVADITIIDRDTIERSGAGALADVLARVPGIEFSRQGGPGANTEFYLRGADTRFTAVFIDGVRVDSQSGSGGASWAALPLAQVERVEVLRGPAGAIYGSDAVAGVVHIFTRKGEGGFAPHAGIGYGSHETRKVDSGFSGKNGAWDYSIGYAHEKSDGYDARTDAGHNRDIDGYRLESANARLGLKLNADHRLEATLLESRTDTQYDSSTSARNNANRKDDHALRRLRTAALNWQAKWNAAYSTQLTVSEGRDRYETQADRVSNSLSETKVRSYLLNNELRIGASLLTAALERREDELDSMSTPPLSKRRSQNAVGLGYGLKRDSHTLQLNARHDQDSEFGGKSTGSIAYAYALTPQWRATASLGSAFRAPTLYQRFHPTYGNAALRPETAFNKEVGIKFDNKTSSGGLTVYQNRLDNLIFFDIPANRYQSTARAQLEGATLSGSTRVSRINLRASFDWQKPRDLDTGKLLKLRARRHANIGADTSVGSWTLGGEVSLSGKRYNDANNTVKLGGYGLLNLYASTHLGQDWSLLARIDNVADRNYTSVLNYATPGRTAFIGLKWTPR
ncbi:MAG TPA: TonB-dependent receptor [Oxalobacteraceae bacterium]|nr:TonB-dependent receptor [Oxalobacteraceae bacterium]